MLAAFAWHQALRVLCYAGIILVFAFLERLFPVERQRPRDFLFNGILFVSMYVGLTAYFFCTAEMRSFLAGARQAWFGIPNFIDSDIGIGALLVRFLIFVLAIDFIRYWMHRAMHSVPALWRFHRAHHSDRAFNASTNVRDQWLGVIYGDALIAGATGLLFGGMFVPLPLTAAYIAYGFFTHANLRLGLGPLTPLFVGPQYHRIHHSLSSWHANRNFASFFPLFDILFGTYYAPKPGEFPATGLLGERHDGWWRMQLLPFRPATSAGVADQPAE
jgi:sterol desaturase/sphingolipid hydroxylase (fatty acid hydroxylase superfamily)